MGSALNSFRKTWISPKLSARAMLAEWVGMTLFITIATGTASGLSELTAQYNDGVYDPVGHAIGTAMAFGFTITAMVFATSLTSGGQLNPAVTVGLVAGGRLSLIQAAGNIVAQVVGAITGSAIVYGMYPGSGSDADLGANGLRPDVSDARGFLGEMVGTFALVYVVLQTAATSKGSVTWQEIAPIPIGFTVFVVHLLLIPFTSCSINPARSLGPAIVANAWGNGFWVFMVAPIIGALLAAAFHHFFESGLDTVVRGQPEDLETKAHTKLVDVKVASGEMH